jgi:hypothetical protein
MKTQKLLDSVKDKYGEWLEMAGEKSPILLNEILASMLVNQIEMNDLYIKKIKYYENGVKKNEFFNTAKS